MALEKYHFSIEHRPRTQHRNADGLSKRTNDYKKHEKQLKGLPRIAEKWNFLSQEECGNLPLTPLFDVHGRVIPDHPNLVVHLQKLTNLPPPATTVVAPTQKSKPSTAMSDKAMRTPLPALPIREFSIPAGQYPEYP